MKLSITIPTLNRAKLLIFTLEHFAPQIAKCQDVAELIVCNNASDDNTSIEVEKLRSQFPFIQFHDCNNRVPLGDNFKRAVSFSHGEYVILWGDDDIPAPFLISYLLGLIEHSNTELYYFNRLMGYENGNSIKSLSICQSIYNGVVYRYKNESDFIKENFRQATFITSLMFSRNVWERGITFDTSKHYGYEFMGILYYGNKDKHIDYIEYPLCIQRKVAKRAWGTDWPKYALLGLPNMSKDLEREGLFDNGFRIWQTKHNKLILFCYILMSAATDKKKYRPMCREMAANQEGFMRKMLVYSIIYFMPSFAYNQSRRILFKLKH